MYRGFLSLALAGLVAAPCLARADDVEYTRTRDVIYGRKFGTALTMDVFTPKKNAKGVGLIAVVSGGWFSNTDAILPAFYKPFLNRGYTVFAVVHGSQPKYTLPEIVQDINRSVRFIRFHAKDYAIDPDRLGIFGGSAGGHLSLMQGTAGDAGDPKAKDPVERMSSRVQAVACFFPPTDFLNWGAKEKEMINRDFQPAFNAAIDYHELDKKTGLIVPITDEKKLREISAQVSPITHVTADSPPTLIIHGDKDNLVPLQQSEGIMAKFKEVGVDAKLIVKKGEGHGWLTILADLELFADWFDKHLAMK
ncbi:MAG TPA: alpha/beta hydrolase [Planctomycetales bacterium]|jgi:acetyl esterase/lipase|nr:alpha/beta hydrolase [Planctomycetales bacterium]